MGDPFGSPELMMERVLVLLHWVEWMGESGMFNGTNRGDVFDALRSTCLRAMAADDGPDSRSDVCLSIPDWPYYTFHQVSFSLIWWNLPGGGGEVSELDANFLT